MLAQRPLPDVSKEMPVGVADGDATECEQVVVVESAALVEEEEVHLVILTLCISGG